MQTGAGHAAPPRHPENHQAPGNQRGHRQEQHEVEVDQPEDDPGVDPAGQPPRHRREGQGPGRDGGHQQRDRELALQLDAVRPVQEALAKLAEGSRRPQRGVEIVAGLSGIGGEGHVLLLQYCHTAYLRPRRT